MRSLSRRVCLWCLGVLLAGCGQHARYDESLPLDQRLAALGYQRGEAVRSIGSVDLDGWQYLDKQHLLLGRGPGRAYLLTFSRPCNNLHFSNTLGFTTTVGVLTRLDRVVSRDSSGFPEHCLIEQIHRLDRMPKTAEP